MQPTSVLISCPAGQTHGQVKLDFTSPELAPKLFRAPYVGWFEKRDSQLYVNRGLTMTKAKVAAFSLCTFRHTRLTRWAEYMDAFTLAYLAGHSDFSTTRRYVHPQAETVRTAMERAQGGRGEPDEKAVSIKNALTIATQ